MQSLAIFVFMGLLLTILDATGIAMDSTMRLRQQPEVTEIELKSAFIFHLTKFVQWPAETSTSKGPFVVGVIGREPFEGALGMLLDGKEAAQGRSIVVRQWNSIGEIESPDILFIGRDYSRFTGRIVSRVAADATLTVADFEGFADRGGMVEVRVLDGRTSLVINRDAASTADLIISSKLLSIASRVIDSRPQN